LFAFARGDFAFFAFVGVRIAVLVVLLKTRIVSISCFSKGPVLIDRKQQRKNTLRREAVFIINIDCEVLRGLGSLPLKLDAFFRTCQLSLTDQLRTRDFALVAVSVDLLKF